MRVILTIFLLFSYLSSSTLVIGSGEKGKNYYKVSQKIQKILQDNGFEYNLKIKNTLGSVDNIFKLSNGEIDLAIVQNDVAFYSQNGKLDFQLNKIDNISSVIMLYYEPFFIVSNREYKNLKELEDTNINFGIRRSGTQNSAKVLFKSIGILDTIREYNYIDRVALKKLYKGEIQAVVLNYLSEDIKKKILDKELFIVPISSHIVKRLNITYPFFNIFSYQLDKKHQFYTIYIRAMLVTNDNIDKNIIKKFVSILYKNYDKLGFENTDILKKSAFFDNPLYRWSDGTLEFLSKNKIKLQEQDDPLFNFIYSILIIILIIIIFLILAVMFIHRSDIFYKYKATHKVWRYINSGYDFIIKHKYLALLFVMLMILLLVSLAIKYFEHNWAIDNNTITLFDSLSIFGTIEWVFVFATSGYDDGLFPVSQEGKLIASIMPIVGVGSIVTFIGLLTYDQIKRYILEVNGMSIKKIKNHIIVCGWNKSAHKLIKNLTHENKVNIKQIIILAPKEYEDEIRSYNFDPLFVTYIKGSATNRADLDRASFVNADITIIISSDSSNSDAEVILKTLTVEKYCLELEEKNIRVNRDNIYSIVEIIDENNIQIAKDAGADQVISLGDIDSKIFVQAVHNPGVTKVLDEIMTFNDQNDLYSIEIDREHPLKNKTFDEILYILRRYKILIIAINVGYKKNEKEVKEIVKKYKFDDEIITNPFKDSECSYRTKEGDLLIVLAQYEKSIKDALKLISKTI